MRRTDFSLKPRPYFVSNSRHRRDNLGTVLRTLALEHLGADAVANLPVDRHERGVRGDRYMLPNGVDHGAQLARGRRHIGLDINARYAGGPRRDGPARRHPAMVAFASASTMPRHHRSSRERHGRTGRGLRSVWTVGGDKDWSMAHALNAAPLVGPVGLRERLARKGSADDQERRLTMAGPGASWRSEPWIRGPETHSG